MRSSLFRSSIRRFDLHASLFLLAAAFVAPTALLACGESSEPAGSSMATGGSESGGASSGGTSSSGGSDTGGSAAGGSATGGAGGDSTTCTEASPFSEVQEIGLATDSREVEAFATPDGKIYATWQTPDDSLVLRRFTKDGGWTPEEILESTGASAPMAAGGPGGAVAVLWRFGNEVRAAFMPNEGGAFSLATVAQVPATANVRLQRPALDAEGNVAIAWINEMDDFADYTSFAARFDAKTSIWGEPVPLSTTDYVDMTDPVAGADGQLFVYWSEFSHGGFARHFDGTTWSSPKQLDVHSNYRPGLGTNGNTALAVWQGENGAVRGAFFRNSAWEDAHTIFPSDGELPDNFEVAVDAQGNALVIWNADPSVTGDLLRYASYTNGTWTVDKVDYPEWDNARPTQVRYTSCGNEFVATWYEYDVWTHDMVGRFSDGAWTGVKSIDAVTRSITPQGSVIVGYDTGSVSSPVRLDVNR